jgi:formylglycine-generating enzyme required for sulfatase activity
LAHYFLPSVDEWYKAAYYDPTSGVYYDYPTGSDTAPTPVTSGTSAGTAVYGGQSSHADITLAGGLSPYGTMGQGGNVNEWQETANDLTNNSTTENRVIRGGSRGSSSIDLLSSSRVSNFPASGNNALGFRVASSATPEPSALVLTITASAALLIRRRKSVAHNCV